MFYNFINIKMGSGGRVFKTDSVVFRYLSSLLENCLFPILWNFFVVCKYFIPLRATHWAANGYLTLHFSQLDCALPTQSFNTTTVRDRNISIVIGVADNLMPYLIEFFPLYMTRWKWKISNVTDLKCVGISKW